MAVEEVEAEEAALRAELTASTDDGPTDSPVTTVPREAFDVEPPYHPEDVELPADRFLDRELSWLAFNERVLELAEDEDLPLLERVRFAAIFASNLDEFFMVRVAGLKRRIAAGVAVPGASGMRPREVLESIWKESRRLQERHGRLFHDELVHLLVPSHGPRFWALVERYPKAERARGFLEGFSMAAHGGPEEC